VKVFLSEDRNEEIKDKHALKATDLVVLTDIRDVLKVFHHAQELLSSERTPTLSLVLPSYEILIQILRAFLTHIRFRHLHFAIRAAMAKLDIYVESARQNACYGISMFLNPTSKQSWMSKHWPAIEVDSCMQKLKDAMLAYVKAERDASGLSSDTLSTPSSHPTPVPTAHDRAMSNLGSGFRGLEDLYASLNRAEDDIDSPLPSAPSTTEDQDLLDSRKVDSEILRYTADPVAIGTGSSFDLLEWWHVHRYMYPLLWRVARDVLPAQASSVPCERVFSSSKQTTTQQRNSLDPSLVEKLQIMKFGLKADSLDFSADWIRRAEDMVGGAEHLDEA
jgi:hypothetical protein